MWLRCNTLGVSWGCGPCWGSGPRHGALHMLGFSLNSYHLARPPCCWRSSLTIGHFQDPCLAAASPAPGQ